MARLRRLEPGHNDVPALVCEACALVMLRLRVFCTEDTYKVLRRGVLGTVPLAELSPRTSGRALRSPPS